MDPLISEVKIRLNQTTVKKNKVKEFAKNYFYFIVEFMECLLRLYECEGSGGTNCRNLQRCGTPIIEPVVLEQEGPEEKPVVGYPGFDSSSNPIEVGGNYPETSTTTVSYPDIERPINGNYPAESSPGSTGTDRKIFFNNCLF